VGLWRRRWCESGIAGLHVELRPGRPRNVDDERVAELIAATLNRKPAQATRWSVRSLAAATGLSPTSVHRYIRLSGLQPHRAKSFKLSNDPFFVEKMRDIVELHLNPPENALVLCVDEESQCQTLERTQPMLPMGLGGVEGITHD
jgi:putative transposase